MLFTHSFICVFIHISVFPQDGRFSLDSDTCALTTADTLDAESVVTYTLTVTATDHGSPALTATATVTIHITDDNDNPPTFTEESASVQLARTDGAGVEAYDALAADLDSGENGEVSLVLVL